MELVECSGMMNRPAGDLSKSSKGEKKRRHHHGAVVITSAAAAAASAAAATRGVDARRTIARRGATPTKAQNKMQATTQLVLNDLQQNSHFFDHAKARGARKAIPSFAPQEVCIGKELGRGEFGIAFEVTSFCLDSSIPCASPLLLLPGRHGRDEQAKNSDQRPDHVGAHSTTSTASIPSAVQVELTKSEHHTDGGPRSAVTFNSSRQASMVRFADDTIIPPTAAIVEPCPSAEDTELGPPVAFVEAVAPEGSGFPGDVSNYSGASCCDDDDDLDQAGCGGGAAAMNDDGCVVAMGTDAVLGYQKVTTDPDENSDDDEEAAINLTRQSMKANVFRNNVARYAIKKLRPKLDGQTQLDAATDLACEAMFLQSISHTNIIKLRGTVGVPGTLEYAIVLDRLTLTLDMKIGEWRRAGQHTTASFIKAGNNTQRLLTERLLVVLDLARALRHLHRHRILFRDLKPENIGFDVRGDVQIFDFGLAKELKDTEKVGDDAYSATGLTGTRRYMAPEVVKCLAYGLSADVYSYAILFWECLAMKLAFVRMSTNQHYARVVVRGRRPGRLRFLPSQLQDMMMQGWDADPKKRPTFQQVCQILQVELSDRMGTTSSAADRSTHLLNRSLRSAK